ncbi:MAG TPA: hydroxymethylglutaryl-CoA reductase, degradative [Candidatus Thermoplasmatota archaeon]|nr:hydroxymethylglutaryl-CoA reductase, degradative [Candidatus Thermoplasmatota archaeon]
MATWSGFHRLDANERLRLVASHARLTAQEAALLQAPSALPHELAARFIENAVGSFPLPLGFAVGFLVDGVERVVPMAVEESSVVAAASHGAKLARAGGGFTTTSMDPVTIAQVELRGLRDPAAAARRLRRRFAQWRHDLDEAIPSMVARGGGVRRIEARPVAGNRLVLHVHVDTRDAMGANVANTVAERLGPVAAEAAGARLGLRILSNLATARVATASCRVPVEAVGGKEVARGIAEADAFAHADAYRAATHNKGVMNGIDPVALATGNDWRALEAGAHAYAARTGRYRALTKWTVRAGELHGRLELPVPVGTVGGVTRLHPVARACLKVLGDPDAVTLSRVMASVGLAQNLAALRALATEGIQRGHMALHAHNVALQAGLQGKDAEAVARQMAAEGHVSGQRARALALEFKKSARGDLAPTRKA